MSGKLAGVRVVDLSQFLPGPMLTMMMADHGATVIKVEPPAGDPARQMGPFEAGHGVWFRNLNRGKQSLTLNLKSDAGREALWTLLASADVMVEGFRPGVITRLGFGPAQVRARHPGLVYCSISAFGQTGPMADHPAHDLGVQAESGLLALNDGAPASEEPATPVVPGVPAADMAAGLTALSAVLMALYAREKSGEGATIDIAMLASLAPWSAHIIGDAIHGGPSPQSATQRSLGGAAFYNIYKTADGQHITLCGREPKFVHNLLTALDRPDLIPLATADAGPAQHPVKTFLATTFAEHPRHHWEAWFHGKDIAFAPVRTLAEGLAPLITTDPHGAHHIRPAIRFEDDAWTPHPPPPLT